MRTPRSVAAAFALIFATHVAPAQAQDVAAAKALFTQGLTEMKAEHYDKGCPALEESYKLDPRPGTMFTLAECENKRGRVATAVARYEDYLSLHARLSPDQQKTQGERDKTARAQKEALAPLVPMLTLALAPSAPTETVVKRDGTHLAGPALGLALPVDPGDHRVTTQVPGGPLVEVRISITRGEKKQVTLGVKSIEAAPPPTATLALQRPVTSQPPKPTGSEAARDAGGDHGPSGRRVGAYLAGGIGGAGLILGAVMGGLTLSKKSVVSKNCGFGGDATGCNDEGLAAASEARTTGLVSTVGFAVGAAGVAAAVVLLLTEPKRAPAASAAKGVQAGVLSMGTDGATLGLRGAW